MTDDQRFAARRPDVWFMKRERLMDDTTLAGDIWHNCRFRLLERMRTGL
jgi:hypothetical protein